MKNKVYKMICAIGLILGLNFPAMYAQPTIDNEFFDHVDYIGAFGDADWTQGWANWTPQATVYPAVTDTIEAGDMTSSTTWSSNNSVIFGAADFTDAKVSNAFFDHVDYVGAFGTEDWTSGWANWDPQNKTYPAVTDTLDAGDITSDITLTADKVYYLDGWVYVKSGATITIQAGTVIRGSKANKGALIIEKGAKIMAEGTWENPIVFTSNQDAGSRSYGDWGGVIVLGNATVNKVDPIIEGGPTSTYGGSDDADNSGVLKYVRIEFPGVAFMPDKEINGLTMGGVGSGTNVDYIQVSYSGDDSYEWFGGAVNAKHLIAFRGWDDDWDTDYGYHGMVQFCVTLRDPSIADPGSGSNGFESDNDATGSTDAPLTTVVFSNISCFGPLATPSTTINPNFKRAMHLRRNTNINIYNSILAGYAVGLFIDGTAAQANATNGDLNVKNVILAGCRDYFADNFDSLYFTDPSRNNRKLASNNDLGLADPFNLSAPNFLPEKKVYFLNGWVYVKDGATLTIDAGTVIRGSKANKGALIIEKGAKIMAEGTADNPIIFTSNQDAGSRSYGDWGGVIILGKATVNKVDPIIEGGPTSTYGGSDDADNSGVFKYVRIEFPGVAFMPDKEINGLTMGGVGNGTSIENIQVSYSGDDSYEWFGGDVNAKHLIAFRGWDDDFDTDYGYRGMVQYAVALRDPAIADPGSGSNGFESDNDATGSTDAPFTNALFSNVSSFGPLVTPETTINPNFKRAMHLRRNTSVQIYNTISGGWPTGLFIDGTAAQANATNGDLKVMNVYLAGNKTSFPEEFDSTYFTDATLENMKLESNEDLQLTDPFNLDAPDFLPLSGSPVLLASVWYEGVPSAIDNIDKQNVNIAVYPNPFTESVKISFTLNSRSHISIVIYDMTGSVVSSVANETRSSGYQEFNVSLPGKGMYVAKVNLNSNQQVVKLISQ
jgi:hypothetical protein